MPQDLAEKLLRMRVMKEIKNGGLNFEFYH